MCGIFFYLDKKHTSLQYLNNIKENVFNLLNHRGPDNQNSVYISDKNMLMLHTRLHIMGNSSPQPLINNDNTIYLIINGEIFNWQELSSELNFKCEKSDCEIIIPLYIKYIREEKKYNEFFNKLNGQFSFVLYDKLTESLFISRDHVGITPLYYSIDNSKLIFSSELKAITFNHTNNNISIFEPRHYMHINIKNDKFLLDKKAYISYDNIELSNINDKQIIKKSIKNLLEKSVYLQLKDLLNENSPEFGVLLSGGLDSSLIASIVNKQSNKKIKTFSIGISKNATDLIAARKVAKFLNTDHYEFYFTPEEGIAAIKDVIWYIESYDTTTVRASTAMYLLTKKIKEKFPNLKILFSGELSDELFCYLYGGNAPNKEEYRKETIKLVNNVHLFDCLRSNKTCMANSIEVRVPFTDPEYVKYVLQINPEYKIFGKLNQYKTIEKQLLREAFDLNENDKPVYLPNEILFRKKEAFSDGVSNHSENEKLEENWIDSIMYYCKKLYKNKNTVEKINSYKYNKPNSLEELYYREIFTQLFNIHNKNDSVENLVKMWKPNWCGDNVDPSARKHLDW